MGKIIVIDGLDGSGKATQAKLAYTELMDKGYKVHLLSFPNYESRSSELVKMYLSGDICGDANDVNPYAASSFYAADRYIQYKKDWQQIYNQEDSIIIADRYMSANIIHQGGKLATLEERKSFYDWVYDFEVKKVGIPEDNLTIILKVPVDVSQALMFNRYKGDSSKKDIHESNETYLNKCYDIAKEAIEHFKNRNWVGIECVNSNRELMSVEEIHKIIMSEIYYKLHS